MGFNQNFIVFTNNFYSNDVNGSNRRDGVSKTRLAVGELKPEVVDILGAGFDAPGSQRIGWQTGFEPIGESLRGGEEMLAVSGLGHDGDFEKTAGV